MNSQFSNSKESLELEIADIRSKINSREKRNRKNLWIAFGIAVILIGLLIGLLIHLKPADLLGQYKGLFAILFTTYLATGLVVFVLLRNMKMSQLQSELDELEARKRISLGINIPQDDGKVVSKEKTYFDSLVNINIENLAAYYAQVKSHTNKSFIVSLGAGIVGFILIITGIAVALTVPAQSKLTAELSTLSGIIIEFISAVFFFLYNKTVIQMKEYFDSLLKVQNILLSFKIVQDTSSENEKIKMFYQMIGFLMKGKEISD